MTSRTLLPAVSILWLGLQGSEVRPAAAEDPAAEFQRIARELYEGDCAPFGAVPGRELEQRLAQPDLAPAEALRTLADLGREWVELGRVDEAIARLEDGLARAERLGLEKEASRLHRELALAYLRLAEDENCIARHTENCCILPLADDARHSLRTPAEKAREHYLTVLARAPGELATRWVVNVLSLLLGDHPAGLSEALRIPPEAFGVRVEAPRFSDVAVRAGLSSIELAGGVAAEDFDGDGWIDVLTSSSDPRGPLHYYKNRGDGSFEDRSSAARVSEQLGGLNLIAADYDNDGDRDAFVLRGGWLLDHGRIRNSLLRNDGGQTFVDVTRAAGVADPACPTQTAVFGDYDGDGWLDLYVGNESRVELKGAGDYPSQLFLSRRDGTFQDVAARAGVESDSYTKGVAAGDYDDDGDLDLYVSSLGANRLFRNDGHARFEDVARAAGVEEPRGRSFATWFFDQDNDGHLDLWVGAYSASLGDIAAVALGQARDWTPPCLYRNTGRGTFRDVARELGLARPMLPMGANFGDIDNDGWLDLYLGTGDPGLQSLVPNLCFRSLAGQRFADETAASGLGHLQKGHGVAFADFDHDGDQDLFHHLGGFVPADRFQNALFENRGTGGHWLTLELEGTRTNRDAVGARIRVVLETPGGPRELYRAAGSVSSFGGSTHRQEIGLGDATRIVRLEIRWPRSPATQVFEDVPLDAWLAVREGDTALTRLERRRFRF